VLYGDYIYSVEVLRKKEAIEVWYKKVITPTAKVELTRKTVFIKDKNIL
jgi:hypothetical protein